MITYDALAFIIGGTMITLVGTIAFFYLKSLDKPKASRKR